MPEPTHYINVDLDLAGSGSAQPLLDAWGERVIVLHHTVTDGRFSAGLETSPELDSAEAAILEFVELVRGLDPSLRALWDGLDERVLDIGIQAGPEPRAWRFALAPRTLRAIDEIGARLDCTVYAPYEDAPASP